MDTFSLFTDFLLRKEFKLIEDNKELLIIKYELNGFFVKISQERTLTGQMGYFISLSRVNNHSWKGWYSINVVRYLILNSHYILDDNLTFEDDSKFFMEHYSEILLTFTALDFPEAEAKMAVLKDERAKAMFGDHYKR